MVTIMAETVRNVLLPVAMPTRKDLRAALAQIIRAVQHQHDLTDEALADKLGISTGTVANVRNERTDLNQETIAKIGAHFGPETLDPWSACYGGRNMPRESIGDRVNLRIVSRAMDKLVAATDPDSPAGMAINHQELADMAGEILDLQRLANGLAARIHQLGIAA